MRILGIETSCDETGVSIIDAQGSLHDFHYEILGNALISQTATHAPHGGVFPALAKREHGRNLVPILGEALRHARLLDERTEIDEDTIGAVKKILYREEELANFLADFLRMYGKPTIDAIAVTHGPGLEPALWVGVNFAKALSRAWHIPIVPVNHMEGHIVISALCGNDDKYQVAGSKYQKNSEIRFPLLSLLISGGHTELVLSQEWMHYKLLGQTRDDAVGEAFDKVARLMNLPYPGGPEMDKLATAAREENVEAIPPLPRPMIDSDDYDFSFAGLKTAVRRFAEAHQPLSNTMKKALAREFEDACVDVLIAKTMRAIEETGARTVVVGGGVSANQYIRERLAQSIKDYGYDAKLLIPPRQLATDNALMIALAGYFHAERGAFVEADTISAHGNLALAPKD